jgi:8-oxo-dGTP pyrophosphatase MutT (NUDIX family)
VEPGCSSVGEAPHPFGAAFRRALAGRQAVRRQALGATPAAVLAALFEGAEGEPRVWLLRRPDGLRSHGGQVALPGGKRDAGDADPVATALREAEEEIGLPAKLVDVLGTGDDILSVTGFLVTPVVGWIPASFAPRPNPGEVARVFSAPFSLFRTAGTLRAIPIKSLQRLAQTYCVEGEIVWGLTAAILGSLAALAYPTQL